MTSDQYESALILDGSPLKPGDVETVAKLGRAVDIAASCKASIQASRDVVMKAAAGADAVYGINTGFGSLARQRISPEDVRQVQRNLIRSHAAGVGEVLDEPAVRAMLLLLAASLCRGYSGVRIELIDLIVQMLNRGVRPIVPSRGSVGASGDLAPLAHAALVMIGEGEAILNNTRMSGAEAMQAAGLLPITLEAKEGLALINGTHLMCAMAALAICDIDRLSHAAIIANAMAIDACFASDAYLDARIHDARGQQGQIHVARSLKSMLSESQIAPSHKENDPRVQDPYSLRASPQVLGAAIDTIEYARSMVERELGAVTDNPLVFTDEGSIISGGNFHGMPLAIAMDSLKIALSHVAGIAERRIYWLLAATDSENNVNIYLSPQPGLHSGLMIAQYTAAACCNELQTLASPASVANIPTSAGMEDYNSMGATSAHHLRSAVELATNVIAIELLVMAEAMEYHRPLRSGDTVERAFDQVRSAVPRLVEDRPPSHDIEQIASLIRQGAFAAS